LLRIHCFFGCGLINLQNIGKPGRAIKNAVAGLPSIA
jgi:hypothetical protein